jgi:hypothetical protein
MVGREKGSGGDIGALWLVLAIRWFANRKNLMLNSHQLLVSS